MSGLYNAVGGYNAAAPFCLYQCLGVDSAAIPRFRDAWLSDDGKQITVFTRTGGGNRAEYEEDNARIATLPGYIDNCDDPFDSTYAHFHYAVPEHRLKAAGVIAELMKLNGNGAEYQGARRVMDALNPDTAERYKKARIENSARISELIATLLSIENAA